MNILTICQKDVTKIIKFLDLHLKEERGVEKEKQYFVIKLGDRIL